MKTKVIVLGGGIGGLTAAHELVERGFAVRVFERGSIPGGKARSMPVPGSGKGGRPDLPGEHGFRFFPGFYKHLPDTMRRIAYVPTGKTVFDNLRKATGFMIARIGRSDPILPTHAPTTPRAFVEAIRAIFGADLGIPIAELLFFATRLVALQTSCDARRLGQWEKTTWWKFIRAEEMSEAYRLYLAKGLTRSLVAMRAEEGSTRTVGYILLQLLYDLIEPGETLDRLLDGPTNEVFIGPWLEHIRGLGGEYVLDHEVKKIHVSDGRISGVTVSSGGVERLETAEHYVLAMPVERVVELLDEPLMRAAPELAQLVKLKTEWMNGLQIYLHDDVPLVHGHTIFIDSPWSLTSVSQQQFWGERLRNYGDGTVRGILSIDISDWESPGIVYGKPAKELTTREQIYEEVLAQIERDLHPDIDASNVATYFLDPDIVLPNPSGATNLEPLLVNLVDSWKDRPEAVTSIPNLFLASDYVRTYTDLATMEGANEAARRAVNGLLEATGSTLPRCALYPLEEPWFFAPLKLADAIAYALGLPNAFALDLWPTRAVSRPSPARADARPVARKAKSSGRTAATVSSTGDIDA